MDPCLSSGSFNFLNVGSLVVVGFKAASIAYALGDPVNLGKKYTNTIFKKTTLDTIASMHVYSCAASNGSGHDCVPELRFTVVSQIQVRLCCFKCQL